MSANGKLQNAKPAGPELEFLASGEGWWAMAVCLTICSALFELSRVSQPEPRPEWFAFVRCLHRVIVFVLAAALFQRAVTWFFGIGWLDWRWAAVVVATSFGGTVVAYPTVYDEVVLRLYVGLALYDAPFVYALTSASALIIIVRLARTRLFYWLFMARIARMGLGRYFARQPEGELYHEIRAIHKGVFGWTFENPLYEKTLRECIRKLPQRETSRYKLEANLARYLARPVADRTRSANRLVEAAELLYELTSANQQTSMRLDVEKAEREVYATMLGNDGPYPGHAAALVLRAYRSGCILWHKARWLRAFLGAPSATNEHAPDAVEFGYPRGLVQFIEKPGSADELREPLASVTSLSPLTRRLVFLALAKWMERLELSGDGFYHEDLIEGHTSLRRTKALQIIWPEIVAEPPPPATRDWLIKTCTEKLNTAWRRYEQKLESIDSECRQWAQRLAKSNELREALAT